MATLIDAPTVLRAAGTPTKEIREFIGRVNTKTEEVSIARMISPQGWSEPAQTPAFNEYTVVLKGSLEVTTAAATIVVQAGQAVIVPAGERVQYATPDAGGAEYIAVCVPAFSPALVHREGTCEGE